MKFYKCHGAGNDFVIIDSDPSLKNVKLGEFAKALCDRRHGIGGNGLLILEESQRADVRMRIFNPDGSEAEMCGNGIRCFAKYAYDKGVVKHKDMEIETLAGVKRVSLLDDNIVEVELGRPEFERKRIPAIGDGKFLEEQLEGLTVSAVNLGVPHAVVFAGELDSIDVYNLGRKIRTSQVFPKGANVNFLESTGENTFRIRTYERGVEDETYACGTGISASAAVAVALGRADPNEPITIEACGGRFSVKVNVEDGEITGVRLRGPVSFVFEGEVELEDLLR
ncbi:MAG: diaminopimelate epimerase [Candidatus Hydrothermarchaeaceae archaeon]